MLAMVVNDNVGYLVPRGAWATIASMLTPTGWGEQKVNCGKQIPEAPKARHKAAVNSCFAKLLSCPRLLWNWL